MSSKKYFVPASSRRTSSTLDAAVYVYTSPEPLPYLRVMANVVPDGYSVAIMSTCFSAASWTLSISSFLGAAVEALLSPD